jgi:hypothetical protein
LTCSHLSKTLIKLDKQLSKEVPKTEKSSINTSTEFSNKSEKIAIMARWKVAGALHRPNGILRYANVP